MTLLFKNARVYTPDRIIENGSLLVRDGEIAGIFEGRSDQDLAKFNKDVAVDEVIDLDGSHLVPGFVDVHVHGGGGYCAMDALEDTEAIEQISRFHGIKGTTTMLATTMTATREETERAIRGIVQAMERGTTGAHFAGIHLEGPFFNVKRCGAQDPKHIRLATIEETQSYIDLGKGAIRMMSIAPEMDGSLEVIRFLAEQGVTVSLGHSDAGLEEVKEAVRRGASHVTHLYNGMSPLHHREPGLAGSALLMDELTVELICDGIHIQRDVIALTYRIKPADKIVLITDAVEAAGQPDGEYGFGDQKIILKDGQINLLHGGSLAGSSLTMDRALRNAIEFTGLGLAEILPSLTINPARQIGLADRIGSIEIGKDADLVVLDEALNVTSTYVKGRNIFEV